MLKKVHRCYGRDAFASMFLKEIDDALGDHFRPQRKGEHAHDGLVKGRFVVGSSFGLLIQKAVVQFQVAGACFLDAEVFAEGWMNFTKTPDGLAIQKNGSAAVGM